MGGERRPAGAVVAPPGGRISVIVPTYRRPDALARCLEGLAGQSRWADEVVVSVRATDLPSLEVARRWRDRLPLEVTTVSAGGQVAAINAGLRRATGDLIALTDDDCVPAPDWLERIAHRFSREPAIGGVGGPDVSAGGRPEPSARPVGRLRWYGRMVGNHHLSGPLQDVDFLKGANMAFRSEAISEFETHLRGEGAQVCNDLHASLAVRRSGRRVVYDPAIVVEHRPEARWDADSRKRRSWGAIVDEHHNEAFTLLSLLPSSRAAVAFAYRVLFGTRKAPGVLLVPAGIYSSRTVGPVLRAFGAATLGRVLALATLLRVKRR